MPTNQLAPPDMPWLTGNMASPPNPLGPPLLNYAAPPPDTTQGAGVAAAGQQAWQWLQDQRAESAVGQAIKGKGITLMPRWSEWISSRTVRCAAVTVRAPILRSATVPCAGQVDE
jgi:hypothetical protein